MKKLFYYLLIFISIFVISCSSEDVGDSIPDGGETGEEVGEETITDQPENVIKTPCEFNLSNIKADEKIVIDCLLDLKGETVTIPSGVIFEFEGGDIINGKLIFKGGTIDGRLLSSQLEVEGDVKLASPEFKFYAVRWNIEEATQTKNPLPPTPEVAFANHENIQNAINLVKGMGANKFIINRLNVFFDSQTLFVPAILLPSDFHLEMTENTYLRVFPVDGLISTRLIYIDTKKNVKVSGGNLIGDRLEHGPSDGGNTLFSIHGGQEIVIDNIHISYSSASGLTVNSQLWEGDANYIPSKNVLITNCTFDSNRMNNLEVTDGKDIIIDNCKSYRAGNDLEGKFGPSLGLAPRIGIVIEPALRQVIERVTVKNSIVEETRTNSILVAGATDVLFTGNTADKGIGWTSATNVQVTNNTAGGIFGGFNGDFALSQSANNVISGNTIKNGAVGIYATNDDIKIFDNTIIDCGAGMQLQNLADTEIYNNTITSSEADTDGIIGQIALKNVTFRNNTIELVTGRSMNMVGVNQEAQYIDNKFYLKNNTITCSQSGVILNSRGFDITGNNFSTAGFGLTNSNNMLVSNNTVTAQTGNVFGINKTKSSSNITVTDNTFENTSSTRLGAYGIQINTVGNNAVNEDSNIVVRNNNIKVKGTNYGIHATDFNGMTITGNTIETAELVCIFFRGNNSIIENNVTINTDTDIQGTNNRVSNN